MAAPGSTFAIDASLRDRWQRDAEGRWRFEMPEGWAQGRSVFGGLTAAAMAALGRRCLGKPERPLRTTSIQLLAPVRAGPLEGEVTVLRDGRSISFVEVRLRQGDAVVAAASLVFAVPRASSVDVEHPPRPEVPDPKSLPRLPYVPGVVPEFTQHADMRWAEGGMPFSGVTTAAFTGLFQYTVRVADTEGVLALADTWPAPTLSLASKPIPASTVQWTAHLLHVPESFEGWFTMRYETAVGAGGLHTVVGQLYDPDGQIVAWSEQLVAVFG